MAVTIRPLTPELLPDWLAFFDGVAFADHPEWSWCYCTFYHLGKADEERLEAEHGGEWSRDVLRNTAIGLVQAGRLQGCLAYLDGQVAGWCNANDKAAYAKLRENPDLWPEGPETPGTPGPGGADKRVKAVTCFIVAPAHRRRGVASALLGHVAAVAAAEGYSLLEAYPATGQRSCYEHYHGHPAMYEAHGFALYKTFDDYCVYQKPLRTESKV